MSYNLIVILGPTATGKTSLAVQLAFMLDSAIISADSRQVYKGMSIGTGKDLAEYCINGSMVPYYLIDIVDAGTKYNVFEYQKEFHQVFESLNQQKKIPILCGGSGLYLEAATKSYAMLSVPVNEALRDELSQKSHAELIELLKKVKVYHNQSDFDTPKRTIRAIEIETYQKDNQHLLIQKEIPKINPLYFGTYCDVETRRNLITKRLDERFKSGMIEEVKHLLDSGIHPDNLIYYGLEYKYITLYLLGKSSFSDMREKLNIAIHQFAKRQMTWFRKMEKEGTNIHWLDIADGTNAMIDKAMKVINGVEA